MRENTQGDFHLLQRLLLVFMAEQAFLFCLVIAFRPGTMQTKLSRWAAGPQATTERGSPDVRTGSQKVDGFSRQVGGGDRGGKEGGPQ